MNGDEKVTMQMSISVPVIKTFVTRGLDGHSEFFELGNRSLCLANTTWLVHDGMVLFVGGARPPVRIQG